MTTKPIISYGYNGVKSHSQYECLSLFTGTKKPAQWRALKGTTTVGGLLVLTRYSGPYLIERLSIGAQLLDKVKDFIRRVRVLFTVGDIARQ